MPTFTAALFASTDRQNTNEQSLQAHAILKEGSRPCWEIHVSDRIFRFIPDPAHMIADGLWQLLDYCKIPSEEYAHDVHFNEPITLEEEFGTTTCESRRADLSKDLADAGINISLITWPGIGEDMLKQSLDSLTKSGGNLIHRQLSM